MAVGRSHRNSIIRHNERERSAKCLLRFQGRQAQRKESNVRNRLALRTLSGTIFLFTILAAAPTALAQSQTCRRQAVADDAAYNATPYNELFQVACHNCYDKGTVSSYAKTFYEVLNKTNFVEIDFWDYKNADGGAQPHHWFGR